MTTNPDRVPAVTIAEEPRGTWCVRVERAGRAVTLANTYSRKDPAIALAASIRGAIADAYHAGRADGLALPHVEAHEIERAPERDNAGEPLAVWELLYLRNQADGTPADFSTTIEGPPPIEDAAAWRTIPADVRTFARYLGRANGAHQVTYTTTRPADVTGYAEHRSVARVGMGTPWHVETIGRGEPEEG